MPHAETPTEPSRTTPRLYALVPCAGFGERAGTAGPKQYETLAGRTVVGHTLAALSRVSRLHRVLVVLSPSDALFESQAPDFDGWIARTGGATRADTVAAGLRELSDRGANATDWVLVHDAARCLINPEWVDALIDACLDDDIGGVVDVVEVVFVVSPLSLLLLPVAMVAGASSPSLRPRTFSWLEEESVPRSLHHQEVAFLGNGARER